jgi:hypothetical protein
MKNFRVIFLGGIVACTLNQAIAQSTAETALLFSRVANGGSARVMGMGGASISLGGDFTSASANPAGLGMFNRSEFSFSPSYSNITNHTTYWGNKVNDSRTNLAIPSLSFAFQNPKNRGSWISSTFAITLTRMNDFHSTMTYEGRNRHNSIGDYFANDSFGIDPGSFTSSDMSLNRLAYDNFLIDPYYDDQNDVYFYGSAAGINIDDPNDVPNSTQTETKTTSGAQNQWSASYGVNIDDKFFLGASLHLRSVRFENKSVYQESNFDFPEAGPGYDPMNTVLLEEKLKITGSGFSATIGAIIRPVDGIQVGMAYNTPTVYTMSDVYTGRIATDWNNWPYDTGSEIITLDKFDYSTDELLSDYKLRTPGRLSVGATYFFGKNGFVSGDAEFINFVGARYKENEDFESDNPQIRSLYRSGVNARIGGEYRLKEYRFRAGYNYMSDPLSENQDGVSRAINRVSIGAGIRKEKFYVDVALMRSVGKNLYRPYSVPGNFSPAVDITANTTIFMFTVGLPFR